MLLVHDPKDTNIKVSVCVPIYGVEQYVEKCVRSLMEQTMKDGIEFIFVNDCTKDKSIEILKKVVSEYPERSNQVKIVNHETNKGLSAARNTGVKSASGDYILFVDSDDELTENAIELLTEPLSDKLYDVVVGNYNLIGNGTYNKLLIDHDLSISDSHEIFNCFLKKEIYEMAWNKLIRKDFFIKNNLWFIDGLLHEDNIWSFYVFYYCRHLFIITKSTYRYRVRTSSIMGNISRTNTEHLIKIFNNEIRFIKRNELQATYPPLMGYMVSRKLSILYQAVEFGIERDALQNVSKEIGISNIRYLGFNIPDICRICFSNLPYPIFKLLVKLRKILS